ncbi:hypothetical protein ABT56_05575 [Photobacterium aquae]|uniref:Nitrite reductase n=1 Tax=Photobacterium aquae TaxID=1195763 RepID=A0A0J1H5G6_9GAMM|nr:hypothetical protein [Photobacterium aquae]KLV07034.1 hypothetical protein ABT56_05575 [Photobacterium aquae]
MDIAIIIIAIIFGYEVIRRLLSHREAMHALEMKKVASEKASDKHQELQQEISSLQERVAVLEKIVVDKSYQVKKEIESLYD